MVRAETEPKTGTLLPFSPSEMAKTGTILKPRDLSNLQPCPTTSKPHPEIYPDDGKKGREMTKEERESSTYTKEITAVVEDLDLAPKRRSLLYFQHLYQSVRSTTFGVQSLYQCNIFSGHRSQNEEY